jgi:predicted AAA+ superfamily ATPase
MASFYRTSAGAEIDLLLELPGYTRPWAIEIKHSYAPKLGKGLHRAIEDTNPEKTFVVYGGAERFPLTEKTEVIPLPNLCNLLASMK